VGTIAASLVLGWLGIQGEVAGGDGGTVGRAPRGAVAARERRREGGEDYPGGVETGEVERSRPGEGGENAPGEVGAGGAAAAEDRLDGWRNRPPTPDGKLEESEQQALSGSQDEEAVRQP